MNKSADVVSILPGFRQLRGYRREWLASDFVAGCSVCVILVPSVIAYAELVGVAPVHGLYAALAGMIAYAVFASSRHVITGPDAAISLLVASAVAPLAQGDPARAAAFAALLALLCGLLMVISGRLNVGALADLLSKPLLVGYLSGAALLLIGTQLGRLCGIRLSEDEFFPRLAELAGKVREFHWLTLGLGLGFIVLLVALRRFAPKVPGALAVFVAALVASASLDLAQRGVAVIGPVPSGLPDLALPQFTVADVRALLPGAIGIAFLTFPEGILLARAFAAKNRTEVDARQELAALGMANVATGLFQGFSVGASQSRTAINDATGGKTQLASLFAAAALALFLLFLTPLLALLPTVALASILIFAGAGLIEVEQLTIIWRLSRPGFLLAMLTGAGVLVVGVVPAILIGVMLSLVYLIGQISRPLDVVLRESPVTGRYHDLGEAPVAETVPGMIAYRFYAPLLFSNANHFVGRVRELIAASPSPVRWFLLDAQAITTIDLTAAESLFALHEELVERGIELKVARANRPLRERLERVGLKERLGEENFFPSVHAAVEAFQRLGQRPAKPSGA